MFESVSARGLWAAFTQLQEKRYTESLADAASCKPVCSATLLGGFRAVPGGDREYQGSTPQAAKPSSHLDTKSPHSWIKGVSPDHASTGQGAGDPQRQREPQHPSPSLLLPQLITACSHGSASKIFLSLHSVVHQGSLVWKVLPKWLQQQQSAICSANLKRLSKAKSITAPKHLVGIHFAAQGWTNSRLLSQPTTSDSHRTTS